jgi:hypothetical protein
MAVAVTSSAQHKQADNWVMVTLLLVIVVLLLLYETWGLLQLLKQIYCWLKSKKGGDRDLQVGQAGGLEALQQWEGSSKSATKQAGLLAKEAAVEKVAAGGTDVVGSSHLPMFSVEEVMGQEGERTKYSPAGHAASAISAAEETHQSGVEEVRPTQPALCDMNGTGNALGSDTRVTGSEIQEGERTTSHLSTDNRMGVLRPADIPPIGVPSSPADIPVLLQLPCMNTSALSPAVLPTRHASITAPPSSSLWLQRSLRQVLSESLGAKQRSGSNPRGSNPVISTLLPPAVQLPSAPAGPSTNSVTVRVGSTIRPPHAWPRIKRDTYHKAHSIGGQVSLSLDRTDKKGAQTETTLGMLAASPSHLNTRKIASAWADNVQLDDAA